MPQIPANRAAAIFAVAAGVLGALAPILADIDTSSAAGLIAGLLAIVAVVDRFLKGSQAHERQQAQANAAHRDAVDGATSIASIEGSPDYAGASDAYNATQPVEDPEADDVPLEDLPSEEEELAAPPPDAGDYPPTRPLHDWVRSRPEHERPLDGPGDQRR